MPRIKDHRNRLAASGDKTRAKPPAKSSHLLIGTPASPTVRENSRLPEHVSRQGVAARRPPLCRRLLARQNRRSQFHRTETATQPVKSPHCLSVAAMPLAPNKPKTRAVMPPSRHGCVESASSDSPGNYSSYTRTEDLFSRPSSGQHSGCCRRSRRCIAGIKSCESPESGDSWA